MLFLFADDLHSETPSYFSFPSDIPLYSSIPSNISSSSFIHSDTSISMSKDTLTLISETCETKDSKFKCTGTVMRRASTEDE